MRAPHCLCAGRIFFPNALATPAARKRDEQARYTFLERSIDQQGTCALSVYTGSRSFRTPKRIPHSECSVLGALLFIQGSSCTTLVILVESPIRSHHRVRRDDAVPRIHP